MLTVIGICGHNRVGKDTVAAVLCSQAGFTRIALADGVREAFGGLDGPTWELRKDMDAAGAKSREAMQVLGTECREEIGSRLHWANHLLIKIRYAAFHHAPARVDFVIPDIRFPHEPEAIRQQIKAWGGRYETWKVVRPGFGASSGHASETDVDQIACDRTIRNTCTKGMLFAKTLDALEGVGEKG